MFLTEQGRDLRVNTGAPISRATMQHCHWRKIAAECHIRAHENSDTTAKPQAQALVVRIPNSYGETTALHLGFKIEDAEHLHAIGRDGVFFIDYSDVAEA